MQSLAPITTVQFPEGDGYLLIKLLGIDGGERALGEQGSMQPIQSCQDARLAVRKRYDYHPAFYHEGLPPEMRFSNLGEFPVLPSFRRS